ncbi:MAG: glycosyltransferase family 39 protein [Flavobacteriales bacterium]|nr:glycosyltransferase family 39 protein [Flavobacteriales bacterium]
MRNRRLIGRIAVLLFGLFLTQRVVVQRPDNALGWDGFGYWLYLPLTIVHNDLGMQDPTIIEGIFKTYDPSGTFYQAHKAPTGNTVIRYTPGLAFIHLPGFLIAHALAEPLGSPADGFSTPYQYSALITYVLVIVFGLWVLRKVLDELFGPTIALAALLLTLLGTNLLVYFETNPMMTHGYSFALLSLLLWLNMKWHKDPRMRTAIALGAVLGFIALVRPTDAIVALIPLLWPLRDHVCWGSSAL